MQGDIQQIGYELFMQFGHHPNLLAANMPEDIWDQVGPDIYFPPAAAATRIRSTNANDTAVGTGARAAIIDGLDAQWNFIRETAILNGTAWVNLQKQFLRINRVQIVSAGTGGVNAGIIILEVGGVLASGILPGYGRSQIANYSVPNNIQTAHLAAVFFSVTNSVVSGAVEWEVRLRPAGGTAWQTAVVAGSASNAGPSAIPLPIWVPLRRKDDLKIRAITISADGIRATAGFQIALRGRTNP